MGFYSQLLIAVGLLVLGYVFGAIAERRHYQRIRQREQELSSVMLFGARVDQSELAAREARLVTGSVVISIDYFKRFVSGLRAIIGGRLRTYETLVDRARREAVIRMKDDAQRAGANMIFNVKIETASISKGGDRAIGSVEVLAYGTAVQATAHPDVS